VRRDGTRFPRFLRENRCHVPCAARLTEREVAIGITGEFRFEQKRVGEPQEQQRNPQGRKPSEEGALMSELKLRPPKGKKRR
jgi:hypothetical protein